MDNDFDKTIPPRRMPETAADDATMPGKRDRKPDGRFEPGDLILGRYKVVSELGQGGMGVVYKCFDETAGIEVALKALPPELSHNTLEMEDIKENFQLVAKLVHQNIAISKNLEKDNSNGNYYLIMECVEGEDLRRWIKRKRKDGTLTLDAVIPVIRQVAEALDYAHGEKVIHRDIKPGNIMINAAGKVKVLDFGLAAQIHTSMTRVSMAYHGTSGTGPYMAPEQWRGRAQGAAADQYALAVMAYEMLAGHLPFESSDAAVLREAVLNDTADDIANVPVAVKNAVTRAMSKNPAERFACCVDFIEALSGQKVKKASKVKKANEGNTHKSRMMLAAVAFVLLIIAGGVSWYAVNTHKAAEARRFAQELVRKNEKEIASKVQAAYRLQAQVERQKEEIEAAKYDRGQTFGKHLDTLTDCFKAGTLAMKNDDVSSAMPSFNEALKAICWITKNAPLREEAKRLFGTVAENKKKSEEFDASKLAYATYREAAKSLQNGEKQFQAGNFAESVTLLKKSASGYETAYTEARQETLKNLVSAAENAKMRKAWKSVKEYAGKIRSLDSGKADELVALADAQIKAEAVAENLKQAQSSKEAKDWQKVFDFAKAALVLDSDNTEAKNLKAEAEKNLIPSLTIVATINGAKVPAKVHFGDKSFDTQGNSLSGFTENGRYTGLVTYQSGETEYEGTVDFTCNWRGPKEITVALKRMAFSKINLPGNVKLEMVKVKKGNFTMSKFDGENYRDEVEHDVTLYDDFYIGKYEVTQSQWSAIMPNNPSNWKGNNLPVESVTWHEAMEFCNKLNQKGLAPSGWKFTLPSETQWEYAAHGGHKRTRYYRYSGGDNIGDVAWYSSNSSSQTHPVGQKKSNDLGLHDMSGNVWEWCLDNYKDESNDAVADFSRDNDTDGSDRVRRGGSWNFNARYCRSAYRNFLSPPYRSGNLGFRLALVPVK